MTNLYTYNVNLKANNKEIILRDARYPSYTRLDINHRSAGYVTVSNIESLTYE